MPALGTITDYYFFTLDAPEAEKSTTKSGNPVSIEEVYRSSISITARNLKLLEVETGGGSWTTRSQEIREKLKEHDPVAPSAHKNSTRRAPSPRASNS